MNGNLVVISDALPGCHAAGLLACDTTLPLAEAVPPDLPRGVPLGVPLGVSLSVPRAVSVAGPGARVGDRTRRLLAELRAGRRRAGGRFLSSDRILGRLRRPALRIAYLLWLARGAGRLPSQADLAGDDLPPEVRDDAFLLEVLPDGLFLVLQAGRALEERLGRPLAGAILGDAPTAHAALNDLAGNAAGAAYWRCVAGRAPCFDWLRHNLAEGEGLLFERLLLPLSENGGETVTHLFGVALFTGLAEVPAA